MVKVTLQESLIIDGFATSDVDICSFQVSNRQLPLPDIWLTYSAVSVDYEFGNRIVCVISSFLKLDECI